MFTNEQIEELKGYLHNNDGKKYHDVPAEEATDLARRNRLSIQDSKLKPHQRTSKLAKPVVGVSSYEQRKHPNNSHMDTSLRFCASMDDATRAFIRTHSKG